MQKRTYHIDFSKKCGKIKPMHGINLSHNHNTYKEDPTGSILALHKPPIVGLHDVEHPYGQNQYIDIHCIFPDFTREADDEGAYNFAPTDSIVSKAVQSGAEIIFRFGESVDDYVVKPFLRMPSDIEKWADVCLHIIMHFNNKWASGYKWNIKYFEIWSSPDSKNGFLGDVNDYISLYTATARKIKSVFPKIKVGGYSSLGFSAMSRVTDNGEARSAYPFMQKFLFAITSANPAVPLDFFTWRLSASSAEEVLLHSKYAKALLKEYGCRSAKSIVSEFSLSASAGGGAANYLAAMIAGCKSDIDIMLYKNTVPSEEKSLADAVYSAAYKDFEAVYVSEDYRGELYMLASARENGGSAVISSLDFSGAVEIFLPGCAFSLFDITELSKKDDGSYSKARLSAVPIKQNKIAFSAKKKALYIISFR